MVVIAFVAGAVVALILRTMVRAMADHSCTHRNSALGMS